MRFSRAASLFHPSTSSSTLLQYSPCPASADSSRNGDPGSSTASMRSRASHLPRDRWRRTASGPPPSAASRWSRRTSATSSDIARALASKLGEPGWAPCAPSVEEASARGREVSSAAASDEKEEEVVERVGATASDAAAAIDVGRPKRASHRGEEDKRERLAEATSRRGSAIVEAKKIKVEDKMGERGSERKSEREEKRRALK